MRTRESRERVFWDAHAASFDAGGELVRVGDGPVRFARPVDGVPVRAVVDVEPGAGPSVAGLGGDGDAAGLGESAEMWSLPKYGLGIYEGPDSVVFGNDAIPFKDRQC